MTTNAEPGKVPQLVWLKTDKGGYTAQIWHGPPYVGIAEFIQKGTNELGQPLWGMNAELLVKRLNIQPGEEELGLDELMRRYPLEAK